MTSSIRSILLYLGAFAMALSASAANAQFGSLFNDARRGAESAANKACEDGKKGDAVSGAIGGMLGGIGRRTARKARVPTFVPVNEFATTITTEIACKLDPKEQKQAADATLEATRSADEDDTVGPPVGQKAEWKSDTRKNVSGTSTVTSREETEDYADCITVTDVIIVEGEETRVDKRMCRVAGKARYSIVA